MVRTLTSLPSAMQRGDVLARGAHDGGVEAAGEAAVGGRHHDQMALVQPVPTSSSGAPGPDTPAARLAITAAMRWA